jgi:hypothetical protein
VAKQLERRRAEAGLSFKEALNEALRVGLSALEVPPQRSAKPFRTRPLEAGKPLLDNVDNIAEVLAYGEGENFR